MSGLFEQMAVAGHEGVLFGQDADTGLRTIVALHSTRLGPAIGGCRMKQYASESEALADALRLSKGMTYKTAAAGLRLGGGKAVILGDPATQKTPELLRAFASFIERLGGSYIVAEDVGTTEADVALMAEVTKHTTRPDDKGAYYTALGALHAIRACAVELWGDESLRGRRVAIQGIGRTGAELASLLANGGAHLTLADVDAETLQHVAADTGAATISADEILRADCDILAPCALGGVITETTARELRCSAIAGTANGVLSDPSLAARLREKGILYVPDYVANSGGVIKAAADIDGVDDATAATLVERVFERTRKLFRVAETEGMSTLEAADRVAKAALGKSPL